MSSKIPKYSSPAVGRSKAKLDPKDSGQVIENPKMPGQGRMQLRNRKVLLNSGSKPRVRSQTVTKTPSRTTKEPTTDIVQPVAQTPESVRHVTQGAAAAVTQELSRTITKKPASIVKKERKCPAGRIPILGLGLNSPTHVHLDAPDKGPEKPSKLKTPTSTRVFRESKQFSPAHSPQVTPKRLSLLYLALDKENTPPNKPSPNTIPTKPSPAPNSPLPPKQSSGKQKSQLARLVSTQKTTKSTKLPKRTKTSSVSSTKSTSSTDDSTSYSIPKGGENRPSNAGKIKSGTYSLGSLENKDLYVTKDVTGFEPLSQSTPKETESHVTLEDVASKTNLVSEKKDLYVTRNMTGFQPLTQSTPIDTEPPMVIGQVGSEVKPKVSNKTSLPNIEKGHNGASCPQVSDETVDMSQSPSLWPTSIPQDTKNTVQPSTKEHCASANAVTHRPQVTRVASSIVLSSATTSHTYSRPKTSHGQISAQQSSVVSVPRIAPQVAYPHGNVTMCSMHYAGRQLVPVSVHTAPLCAAYVTTCHTAVTRSKPPVVQSTIPHPCVNLFPASQPDEQPKATQMRPSTFADPSLAHLSGMNIRKTSVVKAVSTQPLLVVSGLEEGLDAAADLEVERLTQGSASTAVDDHRMVVNPVASGLDGDFRKYTFQPIHVPARKVLQNEGSAFRRILIC